ncbi:MAG: type II toxin-antitoxin system prevent-host-death family antitoxin [Chloroflexi bacterium]|nr:type II toxin-antitoxin system prevent-host-death family antitoxin [Chloroflexota bacterium]
MRGREAVTERVAASQAKRDWSKVINRAFSGEVRFVVEKHGTPVAGIVSADDIERLAALDARWAEGHEILKRFGRAFRDQTAEEIEEAVAQAVAEVRAENRSGAELQPAPE